MEPTQGRLLYLTRVPFIEETVVMKLVVEVMRCTGVLKKKVYLRYITITLREACVEVAVHQVSYACCGIKKSIRYPIRAEVSSNKFGC